MSKVTESEQALGLAGVTDSVDAYANADCHGDVNVKSPQTGKPATSFNASHILVDRHLPRHAPRMVTEC